MKIDNLPILTELPYRYQVSCHFTNPSKTIPEELGEVWLIVDSVDPPGTYRILIKDFIKLKKQQKLNMQEGADGSEVKTNFVNTPTGIMPKNLHREARIREIKAAIKRYREVNLQVPGVWLDELIELDSDDI